MATTSDCTGKPLRNHTFWWVSLRSTSLAALLLFGLLPKNANAAIVIDPGTVGETFTSKSYDVTSAVRSAGVTNANASLKVLDFIFSELKALRVDGAGLALTAELATTWRSNPSGLGSGFTLLFGNSDFVGWTYEGNGITGDASPDVDTSSLDGPPHFFDVTGSGPTGGFPTYVTNFDSLRFRFRLPNSTFFGFNATVPEEQLILSSATLTLSSEGRSTGVPGVFAFSEYTVVSVPEPSAFALSSFALISSGAIGRRRRSS